MKEKTWKELWLKFRCHVGLRGHKWNDFGDHRFRDHKYCIRCGMKIFNISKTIHKQKRLRHNKWGKSYF